MATKAREYLCTQNGSDFKKDATTHVESVNQRPTGIDNALIRRGENGKLTKTGHLTDHFKRANGPKIQDNGASPEAIMVSYDVWRVVEMTDDIKMVDRRQSAEDKIEVIPE